jgi:hypothetical protein
MIGHDIFLRWFWRIVYGLLLAAAGVWLWVSLLGCHGLARSLGQGATDNLVRQVVEGVQTTLPAPTPQGNIEEILAAAGAAVAVIAHRMWYHRSKKG